MSISSPWVRRTVVLAAIAVAVLVARRSGNTGGGVIPVIGGDTWPPVPVKDTRPV